MMARALGIAWLGCALLACSTPTLSTTTLDVTRGQAPEVRPIAVGAHARGIVLRGYEGWLDLHVEPDEAAIETSDARLTPMKAGKPAGGDCPVDINVFETDPGAVSASFDASCVAQADAIALELSRVCVGSECEALRFVIPAELLLKYGSSP